MGNRGEEYRRYIELEILIRQQELDGRMSHGFTPKPAGIVARNPISQPVKFIPAGTHSLARKELARIRQQNKQRKLASRKWTGDPT